MNINMTFFLLGIILPWLVDSTSFKMDFLSSGTVRTDPLMFSQIGNCLSDHVHPFYGATSTRTMRPDVSYEDLRRATGNTGNVEENKSLYWNPAIYQVKNPDGDKTFELVDIWFASAYYIFRTNKAKAFPNGLKMKAFGYNKLSRANQYVMDLTHVNGMMQEGVMGMAHQIKLKKGSYLSRDVVVRITNYETEFCCIVFHNLF